MDTNNDTVSYLRLDTFSKSSVTKSLETTSHPSKTSETIIMLPSELDHLMGKRTKSNIDLRRSQSRSTTTTTKTTKTKSIIQSQCRQSELELIFQVMSLLIIYLYVLFFNRNHLLFD